MTESARRKRLPAKRSRRRDPDQAGAGATISVGRMGEVKMMSNASRLLAGLALLWQASSACATVTEVAQSAAAGASAVATRSNTRSSMA